MTVDVSKLREGDVVTVRGSFIKSIHSIMATTYVVQLGGMSVNICADDIVSVEPRPLKVFDLVTYFGCPHRWKIIALADGHALIKNGDLVTHQVVSDLSPA